MSEKPLILIVDDNKNLRESMRDILETKGYSVQTAADGEEALSWIKIISPRLIILDMNMPKMGGIVFYEKICDSSGIPRFPIFVLTERSELEKFFRDFVVEGFMAKPFNFDQLLNEIVMILAGKKHKKDIIFKNVAIVDDNPVSTMELAKGFLEKGYNVLTINKGVDAIIRMYETPADIMLIKMGLQDIAGDIVAFRLKNMAKTAHMEIFLYVPAGDNLDRNVIEKMKEKGAVKDVIVFNEYKEIFQEVERIGKTKKAL